MRNSIGIRRHGLLLVILSYGIFSLALHAQPVDPKSFFPHHLGDIWQYRYTSDGSIAYTAIVHRESVDVSGNEYVFMPMAGSFRIDTALNVNVWNPFSEPPTIGFLYYQLHADSGESWIAEELYPGYQTIGTVVSVYESMVFGNPTTIKKIQYTSSGGLTTSANYIASGFGLIQWDDYEGGLYSYSLAGCEIDSVRYGIIVDVEVDEFQGHPDAFKLYQNYPNPFNSSTAISYSLFTGGMVDLRVYTIVGSEIETLVNDYQNPGRYRIEFNRADIPSGVYLCRLRFQNSVDQISLILIK